MIKSKRVLAIIPARGGSQGLPGKNIRIFNGKPMIAHSIEKVLDIPGIDKVIVSTDDEDIARIAKQFGAQVPFLREKHLAQSDTPMVPVIIDVLTRVQAVDGNYAYALMLQANSPLTRREDIRAVIDRIIDKELDVVFTVSEVPHPPQWTLTVEANRPSFAFVDVRKPVGDRRQDQQILYRSTGAVYAVDIRYLLNNPSTVRLCLPAHNQRSGVVITDPYSSTDIDNELDLYVAETIISGKRDIV